MDMEKLADQLLNLGVIYSQGRLIFSLDTGASISPRARAIELLTTFTGQVRADERKSPTITKLVETLRGISEATVMESYDTGKVISAGHKEDARNALAELEKP